MKPLTESRPEPDLESAAIRVRVQRESRLIARLMTTELPALHDECEVLGMPHEGRSVNELRAALFNHLRRHAVV